MRQFLMYMDESGVANLANKSRFFVLSGILVEDAVDNDLSAYLRYLKRRHGIEEGVSLHAYDIFENKLNELYLKDYKKCKKFTASISEFVENAPFRVLVFYIDKNDLREKIGAPKGYSFKGGKGHKDDKELSYEILARKLIFEFARILKKEKAIGSIVAESRRGADRVLLKTYLESQDPQSFIKKSRIMKQAETAKQLIHSICFASKKSLKGALELVDIISYCAYNDLAGKFPIKRNDSRGIKVMWQKIKNQMGASAPKKITKYDMGELASNRINETSNRIKHRLSEYRDLVNPTD